MIVETSEPLEILCEGVHDDAGAAGAMQADFLVRRPLAPATEVGVFVNLPALAYLAERLEKELTPEFIEAVCAAVGRAWLEERFRASGRIDPVLMVSRALLEARPELVEAARTAL